MHTVGLHSALAIKRQRKRREELKKARERRYSSQSTESGLGGSRSSCNSPGSFDGSTDHLKSRRKRKVAAPNLVDTKVVSNIGMLHIGIVFLVLGLFLIGSGLIPDDFAYWDQSLNWLNELVFTGIAAIVIGIFLIVLNHYLSQQEEDELSRYVERQLTRSRSGKRLIKDEETGCLSTKQDRRVKEREQVVESEVHNVPHNSFTPILKSPPGMSITTPKSDLERILEEETSEGQAEVEPYHNMESFNKHTMSNGNCSQQSQEPRELVVTRYYHTTH